MKDNNMERQELNLSELEQVNGGIWWIPVIVLAGGTAYALYRGYKELTK